MLNENNDLVIFEYEAFEKRLYECARSAPALAGVIHACIDKHKGEENLKKLVEGLTSESQPYGGVIADLQKISKYVAKHREDTDSLIQQFRQKHLLDPSEQPLVHLIDAMNSLTQYGLSGYLFSGTSEEQEFMQTISSTLKNNIEELKKDRKFVQLMDKNPELARLMGQDVSADTNRQEMKPLTEQLQEKFREELDYIPKGDETDDIFRDIKKISNEIIPDIIKILGPIVGNERFRSDLNNYLKELEQHIEHFIFRAQSNIDKQIKTALDSLQEKFQERLENKILPQLQQISPSLGLFVSTEHALKGISKNIKDWQNGTEAFITEFVQLPKDIKDSCEHFREDFKCLDALEKWEQNDVLREEIEAKEVEVLKHLFGANGTDVSARLNCESENVMEIEKHALEIDEKYIWQTRADDAVSDELICIFKHAATRVKDIFNSLGPEETNV